MSAFGTLTARPRKNDALFGRDSERLIKPLLEKHFNILLDQQKTFCPFDFVDVVKKNYFELKTRRICSDTYGDVFIGKNKIDYIKEKNVDAFFVFKFNDGLFYIKYDAVLFGSFGTRVDFVRNDRPNQAPSDLILIPTKLLIKIEVDYFGSS